MQKQPPVVVVCDDAAAVVLFSAISAILATSITEHANGNKKGCELPRRKRSITAIQEKGWDGKAKCNDAKTVRGLINLQGFSEHVIVDVQGDDDEQDVTCTRTQEATGGGSNGGETREGGGETGSDGGDGHGEYDDGYGNDGSGGGEEDECCVYEERREELREANALLQGAHSKLEDEPSAGARLDARRGWNKRWGDLAARQAAQEERTRKAVEEATDTTELASQHATAVLRRNKTHAAEMAESKTAELKKEDEIARLREQEVESQQVTARALLVTAAAHDLQSPVQPPRQTRTAGGPGSTPECKNGLRTFPRFTTACTRAHIHTSRT